MIELPLATPHNWERAPLWTIAARRELRGQPGADRLSVYRDHGVVPTSSRDDNFNKPGEDLAQYKVVRPGDLVLNKMKTWQGSLAVSEYSGIVSPAYYVLRLDESVHPRWIHHLLRSQPYIAAYAALSKGIRPNQWDLPFEEFRQLPVLLPPLEEQRRIADFLDTETTRLDALADLRVRQAQTLEERVSVLWQEVLSEHAGASLVPLRRVLRSIVDGPFGSSLKSSHYSDDGARVIRLGNLGTAEFQDEDRAYIPMEYFNELRQHEVRPGDLVIAGLGDQSRPVGRACVIPQLDGPAIVKADCFRVRLDEGRMLHQFAELAISAPATTAHTATLSRGSTRIRINTVVAREIMIPVPPIKTQRDVVREISAVRAEARALGRAMATQRARLGERRQALITAAVTGQLDVTTAHGGAA